MALTLGERAVVTVLAKHLYDYLPASGNTRTSFPLAAQQVGVAEGWPVGASKLPGIVALITWTLEHRRGQFCALLQEVVAQSIVWRGQRAPLTRQHIEELNRLLLSLKFKIPELHESTFLEALAIDPAAEEPPPAANVPEDLLATKFAELESELLTMS